MKENRKTTIFRGLSGTMAFLLMLSVTAVNLTFEYDSIINKAMGVSSTKTIVSEDADAEASMYYTNEYGYDDTALKAAYLDSAAVNVEMEAESAVLLKNENGALPLSDASKITIFGNAAERTNDYSSTQTFTLTSTYNCVTALEEVLGTDNVNTVLVDKVYAGLDTSSTSEVIEAPIADVKAYESTWKDDYNDAAVVILGRWAREGSDMQMYSSKEVYEDGSPRRMLDLSVNEEALMEYLSQQKKAGVFDKIIVVFSTVFTMEMDFLEEYDVDAALIAGEPGHTGYLGVAQIINGDVNPSGHTVEVYASNSVSAPATTYAGVENTQRWTNYEKVNEENPETNDYEGKTLDYYVIYAEGIYVGYKYYETRYEDTVMNAGNASSNVGSSTGADWNYENEMEYPFGYGLSYTTFEQKLDSVSYNAADRTYNVKVTVTNTGDVAGKDVVQVYSQTPYGDYEKENLIEKASVNLIAYDKTKLLEPGESQTLDIEVNEYFLASYDTNGAKTYILSAGDYYLAIGDDSHDALNNILAAKGYTTADGMTAEGDTAKTYTFHQAELDTETYSTSVYTGEEITNAFEDADINYYGYELTYLSRNDWKGTYPTEALKLAATDEVIRDLSNFYYEAPEDSAEVSDFTQGKRAGLKLTDMMDVELDDPQWDEFVDQLTVEEMAHLFDDNVTSQVISELDIPGTSHKDDDQSAGGNLIFVYHATLACSWNKDLHYQRGYLQGVIAQLNGYDEIWYGACDFHRTPFGGRSNQYFSSDAVLDYYAGYEEAAGMQSTGVICCVKHFVINDQETNREGLSTFTNEQAFREIYLRAFEGAFQGGALSTMCSLGRVGTKLAKNNYALLTTVLRDEWGYSGHVTSDGYLEFLGYFQNTMEELTAGMDYACMDSSGINAKRIIAAIEDGDGNVLNALRTMAKRNLYVMTKTARMNGLGNGRTIVAVVPSWEIALMVVNLIAALGFVIFTSLTVYVTFKNNKKKITVEKEA